IRVNWRVEGPVQLVRPVGSGRFSAAFRIHTQRPQGRTMKTSLRIALAAGLLAVMAMLPAFAQAGMGTLQVNGTVMTSTGGEFVPASDGQAIAEGTRLMVSEGSSASITFPNGAVVNFTEPGVYTINM